MNVHARGSKGWLILFMMSVLLICSMALHPLLSSAGAPQPPVDSSTRIPAKQSPAYRAGQILVAFKPIVSMEERQDVLGARGLSVIKQIGGTDLSVVATPAGRERDLVEELGRLPSVRYAELDYLVKASGLPNDPSFGQQWNMTIINAPAAWDVTTGAANTTVAILDTGIDLTHPDLQAKIAPGYDFVHDDATAQDDDGHGTHCAGIAAASTNNGQGVAGVNWQARLMPIKVLNDVGSGTFGDVVAGIRWATDHGATVINMSFGGSGESQALREAVEYAYSHGVVLTAAAGNEYAEGNPTTYPAAFPQVIAVAATTATDGHAWYSNTGDYVDVAAPGGEGMNGIFSTLWTAGGPTYGRSAGTSMAAPHVAGLAALLKAVNPALTPADIAWVISYTAQDLGSAGRDDQFGWGRINALAAVQAAGDPAPTPTPTASPCLVESPHPYPNGYTNTWTLTNPDGTAPASRVHFSRIDLENGWDVIEILDAAGNLRQTITGAFAGGLWSEPVAGSVVQVRLRTDASLARWGFCLDDIETVSESTPTPTATPSPTPSNCLIESAHPYDNALDASWTITNTDSTATYSRVHFSRLETEVDYDYVSLRTPDGAEFARYSGAYPSGLWSPAFRGRTLRVNLHSDYSVSAWGFCVDSIETTPEPAWSMQTPLPQPRSRLAVVAANDKLYAIGGEAETAQSLSRKPSKMQRDIEKPASLFYEGVSSSAISGAVHEYDPTTDRWTARASKPVPVSNISAALLDGLIYVAGGFTSAEQATAVVETYDPAANRWSVAASLPAGRFGHATAALDGDLFVMGGYDGSNVLATGYRYDPLTNQWSAIAPLQTARAFAGAAAMNGKLYVAGGLNATGNDLNSVEVYDPVTDNWSSLPQMQVGRGGAGVLGLGGKLYVAGGGWDDFLTSVEVFDTATRAWADFDAMTIGRRSLGLAYARGRLHAVGGYNGDYLAAHESHGGPELAPQIEVAPTSLAHRLEQGKSAQLSVRIMNKGGADLTFTLSDELINMTPVVADAPWVEAQPAAGVVLPGGSQTITVTLDASALDTREHRAQLIVQSNDAALPRLLIPITLTVDARNPVTLSFNPAHNDVALNSTFRVDVMLNSEAQPVDSVDAIITFDPHIVQVVDIYGKPTNQVTAGVDLPLVLQNTVNNATGRIAYGAGRRLGDKPPSGTFRLATIRFRAVSQTVAAGGMPLVFDPASQVYYGGDSILGHSENGSIIVQAPWFTGKVLLQGRGRAPSTRWAGYPVTVTLHDQAGAVLQTYATTLDENGQFVILTPPSGTFNVSIKNAHTLSNLRQNVTLPSPAVVDLATLREGDVNNDDRVTGADFSLLVTAYNTRPGDLRWDARADLDTDGRIGVADFSLLASNYGLSGPLVATNAAASAQQVGSSMELWIEPTRSLVDTSETFQVKIILNAGDGQVDALAARIAFDPAILAVVDADGYPSGQIIPGTALPTVILNRVDNDAGRIEYDAGISLGNAPKGGRIHVATIRFKALRHTSSGLDGTPITFLTGTDAYLAGEPQLVQRSGAAVIVAVKVARANLPVVHQ